MKFSEKGAGGGQRPFGNFPEIHPFLKLRASLGRESPKAPDHQVKSNIKFYQFFKDLFRILKTHQYSFPVPGFLCLCTIAYYRYSFHVSNWCARGVGVLLRKHSSGQECDGAEQRLIKISKL